MVEEEIIRTAGGYADLGMSGEAEAELAKLPPVELAEPAAVAVRLKIAALRGEWKRGEELAALLTCAEDRSCRKNCAEFHLAYARHLCGKGERESAGSHVREVSRLCPEMRLEVLEDAALSALWELPPD